MAPIKYVRFQFSCSVVSGSLQPRGLQLTRLLFTISWSLHKLKSVESVMPSNHLILCHLDCGPPVSYVHGILQARILEWVVIPFSRASSWPRDQSLPHLQADSLPCEPPGKPHVRFMLCQLYCF